MIDATQLPAVQALANAGGPILQQQAATTVSSGLLAKPEYTYVGAPRAREYVARERIREL